jgi:hypothetical protein
MDGAVIQRILERIPSSANDSVTYRIEECRSSLYQFSATEHLYSHSTDTVYRIYSTAGSKLESLPLEPINLPDGSATYGFMGFLTDASIPVYDRPAKFFPNHMIWTHQDECYTMITYDGCWYDEIYLEGLGGPYHNCTDFGWGPSYNLLKYYKKGNISWGTPLQCDSLLHVGIQESALAESFTLTPNPSHGLLTLCFPSGFQRGMLQLYDLSGRKVVNTPIINNNQTVDISELPAGLYVYRFRIASGKEMHGKIIKQ